MALNEIYWLLGTVLLRPTKSRDIAETQKASDQSIKVTAHSDGVDCTFGTVSEWWSSSGQMDDIVTKGVPVEDMVRMVECKRVGVEPSELLISIYLYMLWKQI